MRTPRRNQGPKDGYANLCMKRDEALAIAADAGCVLSQRGSDGHAISRTTKVELRPCGQGFDLVIPAEHVKRAVELIREAYPDSAGLMDEMSEAKRIELFPEPILAKGW